MHRTKLAQIAIFAALFTMSACSAPPAVSDQTAAAPSVEAGGYRTETLRIGPIDIPANDYVNSSTGYAPRPSGDIAVKKMAFRYVDANGNDISHTDGHLHHLVLLDGGRTDPLCNDYPNALRFAGSGAERTPFDLPGDYAYRSPDAGWGGIYHVMNFTDRPMTVYIEYTVTFAPAGTQDYQNSIDVTPYFMDVTGCWSNSASEFDVPGDGGMGSEYVTSRSYTSNWDGDIVAAAGHLHAGGNDITLSNAGGTICTSTAQYSEGSGMHMGGLGMLMNITACPTLNEPWNRGDVVTLTARYRNDVPVEGAMGIMLVYVHHTGPPPPEPFADIRPLRVDSAGLVHGYAICDQARTVQVFVYAGQSKSGGRYNDNATASSNGTVECSGTGGEFTIRLSAVDATFQPTTATVWISWAFVDDIGRDFYGDNWVTVPVDGWVAPIAPPVPDNSGEVVIDPTGIANFNGWVKITGSVPCVNSLDVSIEVTQFGRRIASETGNSYASCVDGVADWSAVATGDHITPGPVRVTAWIIDPTLGLIGTSTAWVTALAGEIPFDEIPPVVIA